MVVILRGAMDGLAAVPPYGDPDYSGLHGELAIGAPSLPGGALALDGTFGLHPSLAFLHERYLAGELTTRDWGPATLAFDGLPRHDVSGGGGEISGDPLQFVLVATGRAEPETIGLQPGVSIY